MYKTILMHINDESRVGRLVGVGTDLAERFQAHLTAVCVLPHIPKPPIPLPFAKSFVGKLLAAYREEAERAHQAFETAVKGLPVVPEWRLAQSHGRSYCEGLLEHARTSDLVIVSQRHSDWDYADMFDVPEEVAIDAGRPVLIVPATGELPITGQRITVAWNGKREGARAMFDALPLLRQAHDVRVLWINPQNETIGRGDIATAEVCATLSRHGVHCEGAQATTDGIEVGPELLKQVAEHNSDLLVMGCYGHARLREFVLGGATRHILHHMKIPVLMSH